MGILKDSGFVVDNESSAVLSKFNWGAFWFAYFWGLGNGAFRKTVPILICDILMGIPILNIVVLIVNLVLRIIAGINGNKWAYEGRAWYNAQDFEDTQKRYATVAAVNFAAVVIFFIIGLFAGMMLSAYVKGANVSPANKSQISANSPLEEVADDVVRIQRMHGELKYGGMEIPKYIITDSEFAQKRNGTFVQSTPSNSVKFVSDKNPNLVYYKFLFVQEGNLDICNLKQKNCSVTMYQKGKPTGKIYYDNKGNKKQVKVVVKK